VSSSVLLAFDTSSAAVTAAVHNGTLVVAAKTVVDPLRHGELLAPAIEAVLRDARIIPAQITEIAVGVGPGPFTGLRVGLVTARTMGSVLGVPVHGVCSLDIVAAAVTEQQPFLVATDARRREVYWARYAAPGDAGGDAVVRLSGPEVAAPAAVAAAVPDIGQLPVAGRGAVVYADAFPRAVPPEYPSAADLARLVAVGGAPLLPADPLYLRRPDVARPGPRKPVL